MEKREKKTIPAAELSSFCSQIGLILDAGLPLYDGLETLANSSEDSPYHEHYVKASQALNEKGSLYEALKEDDCWPNYLVEMVGIGETSGHMDQVMSGLASYYARQDRIRTAIVSAVTYPLVLSALLVVIVLIMLLKVLPVFNRVLESMGMNVSGSGNALMAIGSNIGWIVLILIALIMVAALVCVLLLRTSARPKVLAFLKRLFPPAKNLSIKMSASRIADILAMMFASGFPTGEAFRLIEGVIDDEEALSKVKTVREELENGEPFADSIGKSGLFESLHCRMIHMAVAAGREDQVMQQISDIYEGQIEDGIAHLLSIIEPTLIALLSIVIGAILLSVMLPMAGILSSML